MSRFLPKSIVCLREGYTARLFVADLFAGLTVAVIALPLAMAFGIASIPQHVAAELQSQQPWLSPPAMGLYTAIVAGFLISALGGSRVQVGGPTGAFIPIVAGVAAAHGYTGLATATLMAGIIVILMGIFRLGVMIKFIPYPVVTGFTSGIAVIIAASQLRDFFGLQLVDASGAPVPLPPDFIPKLQTLAEYWHTFSPHTVAVAAGSLAILIMLRRFLPRLPGAIVAVVLGSLAVWLLGLPVETVGSKFGDIPRSLPAPHMPRIDLTMIRDLMPAALTIAVLCSIESLLSAVVADGMTGARHKSDTELIAQGTANIGSVLFFGIPATGAIARTVANIKAGGRTPVAGMLHAVFLLAFMLALAPMAKMIPLATLAAVLMMVAWNMSEIDHFRTLLRTPRSDVLVLLSTFALTVFIDLTVAVGVGMVLAAMLFMKRMAEVSNISAITREVEADTGADDIAAQKDPNAIARREVPPGVEVYEIDGPFFFGVADRLKDILSGIERPPKIFILRMRKVPAIDATGLHALEEFHAKCHRQGTRLLLSGVHAQPLFAFTRSGFDEVVGIDNMFENIDDALDAARQHLGLPSRPRPPHTPEVAREAHEAPI